MTERMNAFKPEKTKQPAFKTEHFMQNKQQMTNIGAFELAKFPKVTAKKRVKHFDAFLRSFDAFLRSFDGFFTLGPVPKIFDSRQTSRELQTTIRDFNVNHVH